MVDSAAKKIIALLYTLTPASSVHKEAETVHKEAETVHASQSTKDNTDSTGTPEQGREVSRRYL